MKKILTKEEREKKDTRNKIIISIILVLIMVLSTAGYAFYNTGKSKEKKLEYNGIEFGLQDDGFWNFKIKDYEFSTRYNPNETKDIYSSLSLSLLDYLNKPLYFSYDSERQGLKEIERNLGNFVERVQFVCIDNCTEDLPIKNCSNNIIIIKDNDVNKSLIRQEDNCVYIITNVENSLKASDAFIFKILGIN